MEVIKLGTLLLKTLSKPLAKGLKARITTHPTLSKRTEEVGQLTHQMWSKITIWAAGHKSLRVKPLDEATALNQGAEFVSEGFVFAVAGAAVLFEMNRADRIKAADSELKKAKEAVEKAALEARLVSIEEALARVEARTQKSAEESSRRDREAPAGRGWWPAALLR